MLLVMGGLLRAQLKCGLTPKSAAASKTVFSRSTAGDLSEERMNVSISSLDLVVSQRQCMGAPVVALSGAGANQWLKKPSDLGGNQSTSTRPSPPRELALGIPNVVAAASTRPSPPR